MEIKPTSFLLGLGAALVLPVLTKVLRPLAVEAMAAGMGVAEEARRLIAEQMETFEDIAAEARAKREASVAAGLAALSDEEVAEAGPESATEPTEENLRLRSRRRPAPGGVRRAP